MIRLLKRNEINVESWDATVENSPDGHVFFKSWYLDAVEENWSALVEGDYQRILPISLKKKLGITYVLQPIFSRYTGLISREGYDADRGDAFLEELKNLSRYTDICLHPKHKIVPENFKAEERIFQQLSLNQSYEEIRKNYTENLIRNLKKAQKNHLEVKTGVLPKEITEGFKKHQKEVSRQFTRTNYETLLQLMRSAQEHGSAITTGVYNDQQDLLAAACFVISGDGLLYLKGFSSEEGKTKGAMHLLFDETIRQNAFKMNCLDFGGSTVKSVARFYTHFGAADVVYLRIRNNSLPRALRWLKK
jgi:hypothetical protein